MTKRARYVMVEEDDPQFCRFWDAYPNRVSKKEARKAWAKIRPTGELVDAMIAALAWQVPARKWDGEKADFVPYPASWLNGECWKDERRKTPRPTNVNGAHESAEQYLERIGWCSHTPKCTDSEVCRAKRAAARPPEHVGAGKGALL